MNNDRIKSLAAILNTIPNDAGITPIVVSTLPGVGTTSALRKVAEESAREYREIRCGQIDPSEFMALHVMGPGGEIRENKPSLDVLRPCSKGDKKYLIVFDEGAHNHDLVRVLIEQLITEGARNVVLIITAFEKDLDKAEAAFTNAFSEGGPAIQHFTLVDKNDIQKAVVDFAQEKRFCSEIIDCLKNTDILEDLNLRQLTMINAIITDNTVENSHAVPLIASAIGEEKAELFSAWLADHAAK